VHRERMQHTLRDCIQQHQRLLEYVPYWTLKWPPPKPSAHSRPPGQEILQLLQNAKAHYSLHNSPPLFHILSQQIQPTPATVYYLPAMI
jgi:hypothetical protein